jgi:hypothetical protein
MDSHVVLLGEKSLYLDEEFLFDNIRHGLSCPRRDLLHPGLRIQINLIPIRIQSGSRALMTKKTKITVENKNTIFFYQKLQFTYPEASIKNVQVTEEAFSKENIQHFKT